MKLQSTLYLEGGTATRVFLSFIVTISHLFSLPETYRNKNLMDGDFAVHGFFILSGYAMMHNYKRFYGQPGGNLGFFTQRFFRIVVAVFFLIVAQIVLLYFTANCSLSEYIGKDLAKYFIANITLLNFLKQDLPCVFTDLHLHMVNGSLWTMKVEFGYYLIFPILYYLILKNKNWLFVFIIGSWTFRLLASHYFDWLEFQLPSQLMFFALGMLLYKYHRPWFGSKWVTIIGLLWFAKNTIFGHHRYTESLIAYPFIVLALCNLFAHTDKFMKNHDYSFAVYLVHWPIIMVIDQYFLSKGNYGLGYLIFFSSVFLASYLFKKLVEEKTIIWGKNLSKRFMAKAALKAQPPPGTNQISATNA